MMSFTQTTRGVETEAVVPDDARTYLRNLISWGAVFAGVAAALVIQLLMNMLGIGIGMASFNIMNTADNPNASTFSMGAGIWWTVSGILASLFGGIVAGRLCGSAQANTSRWHGFVSWCGATLVVLYLVASAAGGVLGGAIGALSSAAGGMGKAAASAVGGAAAASDNSGLESKIKGMINPNDAQNAQDSLMSYLRASVNGDPQAQQAAKDKAINDLAHAANISPDEARARLDQAEQQYRQTVEKAKQQAAQAAEIARKSTAAAGIFGFIALALGGIAAWFGGGIGAARREAMVVTSAI